MIKKDEDETKNKEKSISNTQMDYSKYQPFIEEVVRFQLILENKKSKLP